MKHGLAGEGDGAMYRVNKLVLTALDGFVVAAHDPHHPIAIALKYEEQKEEAKRRAKDYASNRLPKYLNYFEKLTSADLALWQGIDGVKFAFPQSMKKLEEGGDYKRVFQHQQMVAQRPRIKAYLESERRRKYGKGIWRRYPE